MGEDWSSHSFASTGETSVGAYACDAEGGTNLGGDDATLRIGNCATGTGTASFTLDAGDELVFTVGWQNSAADVYVDGVLLGSISGAPSSPGVSCTEHSFTLPETESSTIDVEVVDPTSGCGGDIQIASVCLKGASTGTTGTTGMLIVGVYFFIFLFASACEMSSVSVL